MPYGFGGPGPGMGGPGPGPGLSGPPAGVPSGTTGGARGGWGGGRGGFGGFIGGFFGRGFWGGQQSAGQLAASQGGAGDDDPELTNGFIRNFFGLPPKRQRAQESDAPQSSDDQPSLQSPDLPDETDETEDDDDEDYIDVFDTASTRLGANYLTDLCILLGCAMGISNICAVKIWQLGGFILDGGILLFPVTYIITDVLVDIFYRRYTNRLIFKCAVISTFCLFVLLLTGFLPAAPDTDQTDVVSVLDLSGRIFFASAIATIISSRVNNFIYDWLRPYTRGKRGFCIRAWVSSFFAHIPDSGLFTVLAFAGRHTTPKALLQQAVTSYIAAFIAETLLLPITYLLRCHLRRKLKAARAAEENSSAAPDDDFGLPRL